MQKFLQAIKQIFCNHDWKAEKNEYTRYDRLTDTDREYLRLTWTCAKCEESGGETGCIIKSVCHKCGDIVWNGGSRVDYCNSCYPTESHGKVQDPQ